MASTRNKNTMGNYVLDQKQNNSIEQWMIYENGANGWAYNTRICGNGLLPGQLPLNGQSYNGVDIEGFLWGINSTNLVNPVTSFTPELKYLESANIFEKGKILMPQPLVVPKNQRPFPIP